MPANEFTCDRCGREFADGIEAGQHEMWHGRKDEGEAVARLLDALPLGTEFTLANAGRAYTGTYRKNSAGLWDQVWAIETPLVLNFEAAHLGFCVGQKAIAGAVERTAE